MHNYRIRTNDIVHTVCMSNHFTASVKTLVLILPMTLIILKCFCITGLCHLVPGVGHPVRALPRPPLRPWHPSRRPGTPLGSPLCVAVLKPDWETSRRWTIGRLRCDHDHDEHTRLGSLRVRDSESESPCNWRACVSKVATRCRHDCHRNHCKSGCWASAAARLWGQPAVTRRQPGSSAADSTRQWHCPAAVHRTLKVSEGEWYGWLTSHANRGSRVLVEGRWVCSGPGPESQAVKGHWQILKHNGFALSMFCLETMACLQTLICSFFWNSVDDAIVWYIMYTWSFSSDRVCVLVLLLLVLMAIYKDYFRIEASTSFLLLNYVVFQH